MFKLVRSVATTIVLLYCEDSFSGSFLIRTIIILVVADLELHQRWCRICTTTVIYCSSINRLILLFLRFLCRWHHYCRRWATKLSTKRWKRYVWYKLRESLYALFKMAWCTSWIRSVQQTVVLWKRAGIISEGYFIVTQHLYTQSTV